MFKNLSFIVIALLLASCSKNLSQNSSKDESAKPVIVHEEKVSDAAKSENKHVVFFDTNSFVLTAEAKASLENKALPMVKEVIKSSNGKVVIEGYCDERGSVSYNKKLGKKRADAVKAFFVKNGVKSSKVKVVSYGKAMPVDAGHTEEAWAKNRRAVTVSIKM